jgi:hypothetical protein
MVPKIQYASHVYLRRGHSVTSMCSGPDKVMGRGPKRLDVATGSRVETVCIDRVESHTGKADMQENRPLARGCPPDSTIITTGAQ